MKSVICFAPCGLSQLCVIACPNNRALGQGVIVTCPNYPELADDQTPMKVEFADKPKSERAKKARRKRKSGD